MIRVMIAEDEVFAREELEFLLMKEKDITIVGSVTNGRELLEQYPKLKPELIFLDIEMPEIQGTEAAKQLMEQLTPPCIIFTTAYEDYAVEAFGVNAVDYLLKPYDEERFQQALARVRKLIANRGSATSKKISNLLIEEGDKIVVVKPEDIYYAVKEDRMVIIYTGSRIIQTKQSLQELEEKLVGYPFVRSHRSYLVNLSYVKEVETWFNGTYNIILRGKEDTKIPVSRAAAKDVLQQLQM
ncbi:LytR/AlgR family response regulator transcription factor [Desulfuribacillus alkaliarsenatis]|uniref:DNA-binding response regulator n=1 Tax=Desulfuribacillus alkaliarsenatis TaxID=766136 RepID=A0A1E5FZ96_9FIRM|nr:LytTR family DNA-binding domain-containing protein [Desulfuribacillus alkaliarsenatis]OEF95859.1 DNA-binding response regulator [Desulfuribacillus alkaliarsenatis]